MAKGSPNNGHDRDGLEGRRRQVDYLKSLTPEEQGAYADALVAHHLLGAPYPPLGTRFLPRVRPAPQRKATG